MHLAREVYRDAYSSYKNEFNVNGLPVLEEHKNENYFSSRKTFYKDNKQIIGILYTVSSVENPSVIQEGSLSIYEYAGENYKVITYEKGTGSFDHFKSPDDLMPGKTQWHQIGEASSIQEFTVEKGVVLAANYQHLKDGSKSAQTYSYKDGLKIAETNTAEDGTVTSTYFNYESGILANKIVSVNKEFAEQVVYIYQNKLLAEEQILRKYNSIQYLSLQKKFFYNSHKELEKTAYYGRYDTGMHLYKTEESIRKGNVLTKKYAAIANLEMMVGYYDLAALHAMMRKEHMEWAIDIFNKKYIETAVFDAKTCTVEKYDDKGSVIEIQPVNPDNNTEAMYGKAVYRNEYNEQSQLEFIIAYRVNEDGKTEEMDIKKYYYHPQ